MPMQEQHHAGGVKGDARPRRPTTGGQGRAPWGTRMRSGDGSGRQSAQGCASVGPKSRSSLIAQGGASAWTSGRTALRSWASRARWVQRGKRNRVGLGTSAATLTPGPRVLLRALDVDMLRGVRALVLGRKSCARRLQSLPPRMSAVQQQGDPTGRKSRRGQAHADYRGLPSRRAESRPAKQRAHDRPRRRLGPRLESLSDISRCHCLVAPQTPSAGLAGNRRKAWSAVPLKPRQLEGWEIGAERTQHQVPPRH